MSPEEQRIAIAEACGLFSRSPGFSDQDIFKNRIHLHFPDYPNDLNACHEMEKALTPDQCWVISRELEKLCGVSGGIGSGQLEQWIWHASAAQRCEAFLKTLSLWKD